MKVDWIDFPVEDITEQFGTLKEGILRGVFRQKAAAAWFGCRAEKAQITVILPSKLDADTWLDKIGSMSHGWPKSTTVGRFQVDDLQPRTFHLYRKFTRARHLWLSLRPDWELIRTHMFTDQPGNYTYEQVLDRSFNNLGRNDLINDTPYQGGFWHYAYHNWQCQGQFMAQFLQNGPCRISMMLEATLMQFDAGQLKEQQEVEEKKEARGQVTRWRTRQGILQVKGANSAVDESPTAVGTEYEEVFEDV